MRAKERLVLTRGQEKLGSYGDTLKVMLKNVEGVIKRVSVIFRLGGQKVLLLTVFMITGTPLMSLALIVLYCINGVVIAALMHCDLFRSIVLPRI